MLTIEKFTSDDLLPLYIECQGQEGPAYLYLDTRNGEVWVAAKHPAHASTWGQDEHNGHVRKWRIPNNLTVQGINDLLEDPQVIKHLETIISSAEEYYDGQNYRISLSQEGGDAYDDLTNYFDDVRAYHDRYDYLEPATAEHFLDCTPYSQCVELGETHEQAAKRLSSDALAQGLVIGEYELEKALDIKKQNEKQEED